MSRTSANNRLAHLLAHLTLTRYVSKLTFLSLAFFFFIELNWLGSHQFDGSVAGYQLSSVSLLDLRFKVKIDFSKCSGFQSIFYGQIHRLGQLVDRINLIDSSVSYNHSTSFIAEMYNNGHFQNDKFIFDGFILVCCVFARLCNSLRKLSSRVFNSGRESDLKLGQSSPIQANEDESGNLLEIWRNLERIFANSGKIFENYEMWNSQRRGPTSLTSKQQLSFLRIWNSFNQAEKRKTTHRMAFMSFWIELKRVDFRGSSKKKSGCRFEPIQMGAVGSRGFHVVFTLPFSFNPHVFHTWNQSDRKKTSSTPN